MKIEHLLVQHFYSAKQVTLQGIGTFSLSPDFVMPSENDKDLSIPPDAITFSYNQKAVEDDALITYIVQQTRKIKPLASSDLESYIMLASQFLNIGKPFIIDGIGVLEKNQSGEYQFTQQGLYLNAKAENAPVQIREKSDEDISFASKAKPNGNNKKILMLLASFLVLGVIIWGAWYFLTKKKDTAVTEKTEPVPPVAMQPDTAKIDTAKLTVSQRPDSITAKPVTPADGYSFKIVIKNYPSLLTAQKAYDRLTSYGHKLLLYTADSVTYKLAMPFTKPLSDTSFVRDSVRNKLFGGKPYIELR
ncbi:flagellar basal body-associated FliL family protein [Ferruginibacter sp.]|nr:hypothetical protein [Ferruginibacter sp.]